MSLYLVHTCIKRQPIVRLCINSDMALLCSEQFFYFHPNDISKPDWPQISPQETTASQKPNKLHFIVYFHHKIDM